MRPRPSRGRQERGWQEVGRRQEAWLGRYFDRYPSSPATAQGLAYPPWMDTLYLSYYYGTG